jgi:class 3 adenylate cyclase/predicted ATPase
MHCARCGLENEAGAKFCEECGTTLVRVCPNCRRALRPTAKFCPGCGTHLTAEVQSPKTQIPSLDPQRGPPEPASSDGERRQLTVMFCDLVGSTALSEQLDPEELREVVRAYQATCAEVIQRFDGHIAQYLGDGLLVYFGYPQAHEDDAQRAVRAGLGILDAMRTLNDRLEPHNGLRLAVRIGIHTGPVVVGTMGSGGRYEQLALGETPNLAARLQSLAAPDTVAISDTTHRLVQGYFTCDDLGSHRLKGIETPLRVYRVVGASAAQSRLDVAGATGLTPLVGREHEVGLLRERWAQSKDGLGQVVLLSGEAGIGKSRLVQVLSEHVADEGVPWLTVRCSPYHTHSAFYPVIEYLQRLLQWHRDGTPEARLAMLEQALQTVSLPLAEMVPLLAALLSLPVPEHYPPLTLSPQRQKQKTLDALVAWLLADAARQPVLAVWEDLQWADPSTLELLGLLLDHIPTARLLLMLTARPEFRPPWAPRSYVTPLTLTRLTRPQVEEMVLRVTGGKPVPAEVLAQIVVKTDGVPLFVEELTKMVLEADLLREHEDRYDLTGPLPPLAIPTTLHDSLMARLDRLAMVKGLAQLGATLGREFAYELLQAVSLWDEDALRRGLHQLVEAEFLYQRGVPPQAIYTFKHALIQDTAYHSLLRSTRQQYHQRIAQVLEAQFAETIETQPELLAQHYTAAGLSAQAVSYWQRAGQRAIERSAYLEASAHLTKGLEVLRTLPDTPERTQQELDLQITLGPALMALKGRAAPEVEHAYARAQALCQQVGQTPQLFHVLVGLRAFYSHRGELQTARRLAEQCATLAQSLHDPVFRLLAQATLGGSLFFLGEFPPARESFEHAIALYDPRQHHLLTSFTGVDPVETCLSLIARTLFVLGYPEQAVQRASESIALSQQLSHPFSLAQALGHAAWIHWHRGEMHLTQAQAEALITLSTEQGFPYWLANGTIFRGCVLVEQGQGEEGIAHIQKGITIHRATGSVLILPAYLVLLAEAYGKVGQAEAGLPCVDEALALLNQSDERLNEAEVYRIKGALLLACPTEQHAEAETCLRHAVRTARQQQAKSLELRATLSLSRLWQQQSKQEAARQMLAEIYGWFTEGFDTADLQEAQALLAALA